MSNDSMETGPTLVRGLPLPLGTPPQALRRLAAQSLGVAEAEIAELRPLKVSVDARAKVPRHIYNVAVWLRGQQIPAPQAPTLKRPARMRKLAPGQRPIIVGTGPAGLWAALRFIEDGVAPILLERGGSLNIRHIAVRGLRRHGQLDPESNLCFGAGGAGTYSDGKLYTRKRDGGIRRIYEDLVALGAPDDILVQAHPHVGTNRLIKILAGLERFLLDSGTDLRWQTRVDGLIRTAAGGAGSVRGVRVTGPDGATSEISGSCVVLATGHSARDVYRWLHADGVPMEPKAFAVGARCEHQQVLIDEAQFGKYADHPDLEPAEYFLKTRAGDRGVYSFCMCPGGFVIPTTTQLEHLNVNGMSNESRGSDFANSALVVTVETDDFYLHEPGDLDHLGAIRGLEFQRQIEARAYEGGGGGYKAPAQRLTDFLAGKVGDLPGRTSYRPGLKPANLAELLPSRLASPLARALFRFDKKLKGFITEEAILIGFETTTSSPIRILRDDAMASPGHRGLYPCGEGAGFAGGIISSALDGIRVADAVLAGGVI